MMPQLQEVLRRLQNKMAALENLSDKIATREESSFQEQRQNLIDQTCQALPTAQAERLRAELDGFGPLETLFQRQEITEILINDLENIWFEEGGRLYRHEDAFLSELTHQVILDRLCHEAGALATLEYPSASGRWRDFRVQITRAPVSKSTSLLSMRRHPPCAWTLERLIQVGWCTESEAQILLEKVHAKKNLLIVGSTGTGKTSVLNAFLNSLGPDIRVGILEDTDEIRRPEGSSYKLLTRHDPQGRMPTVDASDLVRQSLRLRPDRLVMGEIRGGEAKDFLMALSTGHAGSYGTLHADHPQQALLRLELLIQIGAPQWGPEAVRRLIQLSLDGIVWCGRDQKGQRRLKGLSRLSGLEASGFLIEHEIEK